MDLASEWLNGPAGLVAWLAILLVIVASSVGLLVIAGIGGFLLMHVA